MSEEQLTDDQSHYEVSLTAGQAFVAFVFLLLSLAAAFAFGLMIGRGQGDERLVARTATAVISDAAAVTKKTPGKVVDLGADADFAQPAAQAEEPAPATTKVAGTPPPPAVPERPVPHYAQILSSSDQKAAENLAAKLIENGFDSAYVERGSTDRGPIFRVRIKFASEQEARAAEPKLKQFSSEIWITRV